MHKKSWEHTLRDAEQTLRNIDPIFEALIERHGACTLQPQNHRSAYCALLEAVTHQQLNTKAAQTIYKRFVDLFPGHPAPPPELLLATSDETLRGVGLSRQKISYLRDIASKALENIIPMQVGELEKLDDESIIKRLSSARGVGRWTVEMYLIFSLGRLDVLPVDDFGVRNGYARANKTESPTPKALKKLGEVWAPYRSVAAWYLWRAAGEKNTL